MNNEEPVVNTAIISDNLIVPTEAINDAVKIDVDNSHVHQWHRLQATNKTLLCQCGEHVDILVTEGGQPGNTNRMKWKTPEERIIACEALCKELEEGLPKEYLDIADWDTIERYMRDFPVEFPSEKVEAAIRHGIKKIVKLGYVGMSGRIDGFVPRTWEFITQNMTHWKLRHDTTTNNKELPSPIIGGSSVQTDNSDK